MTNEPKLKPCPFCGASYWEPVPNFGCSVLKHAGDCFIQGLTVVHDHTSREAAWNRRSKLEENFTMTITRGKKLIHIDLNDLPLPVDSQRTGEGD